MADDHLDAAAPPRPAPRVLTITAATIADALDRGLRDFAAAPAFGLFFGGIYAVGGMLIVLAAAALDMGYISYPLAVGFALIGPFVAVGLYEVSRRREAGEPLAWKPVLGVVNVHVQHPTYNGWEGHGSDKRIGGVRPGQIHVSRHASLPTSWGCRRFSSPERTPMQRT